MKKGKREQLVAAGYRVTDTREFLGLSEEELGLIDLKRLLVGKLKRTREERGLTQQELAARVGSSQSRMAMMERGRPDVSLDLICRALLALGVSRQEIGRAIGSSKAA